MKFFLLQWMLTVACLLWITAESSGQITYEKAMTYYDNEEYQQAYDILDTLIASGTEDVDLVLSQAAKIAIRLGDTPSAKRHLHDLLELDSINRSGLSQLAGIYEQEDNAPLAIKYYGRLATEFPDNGLYQRKLGRLYQSSALKRDAYRHYARAQAINARDLLALKGMAEMKMAEKEYGIADSLLSIGLKMDSLHLGLIMQKAICQFRQKRYSGTITYLERVQGKLVLKPHQHKMLGYAYLQVDSLNRSIYHLTKSIVDSGNNDYAHYNLAIAYEEQDNIEYAKHHLEEAIIESLSENIDLYHRNLARLYNLENDYASAIPHYKDAHKYGGQPILLFFLARASEAYYEDKAVAIRYYKKYLKSPNENEDYRKYSRQRIKALTEYLHQIK